MARKSKGFSDLLHQKQREEQRTSESLKQLQHKVKESMGEEASLNMVFNPAGEDKMSEVLQEFVDPYMETVNSISELKGWLEIAVLAWNIALMPPEKRQDILDGIFSEMASGTDLQVLEDLRTTVNNLVDRKDRYFSSFQSSITSFDIQDKGDSYFLSVASALEQ